MDESAYELMMCKFKHSWLFHRNSDNLLQYLESCNCKIKTSNIRIKIANVYFKWAAQRNVTTHFIKKEVHFIKNITTQKYELWSQKRSNQPTKTSFYALNDNFKTPSKNIWTSYPSLLQSQLVHLTTYEKNGYDDSMTIKVRSKQ